MNRSVEHHSMKKYKLFRRRAYSSVKSLYLDAEISLDENLSQSCQADIEIECWHPVASLSVICYRI